MDYQTKNKDPLQGYKYAVYVSVAGIFIVHSGLHGSSEYINTLLP